MMFLHSFFCHHIFLSVSLFLLPAVVNSQALLLRLERLTPAEMAGNTLRHEVWPKTGGLRHLSDIDHPATFPKMCPLRSRPPIPRQKSTLDTI